MLCGVFNGADVVFIFILLLIPLPMLLLHDYIINHSNVFFIFYDIVVIIISSWFYNNSRLTRCVNRLISKHLNIVMRRELELGRGLAHTSLRHQFNSDVDFFDVAKLQLESNFCIFKSITYKRSKIRIKINKQMNK